MNKESAMPHYLMMLYFQSCSSSDQDFCSNGCIWLEHRTKKLKCTNLEVQYTIIRNGPFSSNFVKFYFALNHSVTSSYLWFIEFIHPISISIEYKIEVFVWRFHYLIYLLFGFCSNVGLGKFSMDQLIEWKKSISIIPVDKNFSCYLFHSSWEYCSVYLLIAGQSYLLLQRWFQSIRNSHLLGSYVWMQKISKKKYIPYHSINDQP